MSASFSRSDNRSSSGNVSIAALSGSHRQKVKKFHEGSRAITANRTRTPGNCCEHEVVQRWLAVVIMPRARCLCNAGIPLYRRTIDNAPPSVHAAASEELPRGGGTLECRMTPMHMSRHPHTGQRSG